MCFLLREHYPISTKPGIHEGKYGAERNFQKRHHIHPLQPYLVSAMSSPGGRNGCALSITLLDGMKRELTG